MAKRIGFDFSRPAPAPRFRRRSAAGPFYWAGPDIQTRTIFSGQGSESYQATTYAHHYMGLPGMDFNGDGWDDMAYTNGATGAAAYMDPEPEGTPVLYLQAGRGAGGVGSQAGLEILVG